MSKPHLCSDVDLDLRRTALHNAALSLQLNRLRRAVRGFVATCGRTPWKTGEPRVIGFKAELDTLMHIYAEPDPLMATREDMAAVTVTI